MSALLVSEVSRGGDYWRNTAVTPTKIQSSWRRIFVDRSYHTGPFLVGWSATLPLSDCGRVARQSGLVFFKIEFNGLEFGIRTESGHKCSIRSACATVFPLQRNSFVA